MSLRLHKTNKKTEFTKWCFCTDRDLLTSKPVCTINSCNMSPILALPKSARSVFIFLNLLYLSGTSHKKRYCKCVRVSHEANFHLLSLAWVWGLQCDLFFLSSRASRVPGFIVSMMQFRFIFYFFFCSKGNKFYHGEGNLNWVSLHV